MLIPTILGILVALVVAFLLAAGEAALGRVSRVSAHELLEESRPGAKALGRILADRAGYLSVVNFVRVIAESVAAVLVTILVSDHVDGFWPTALIALGAMIVFSFVIVGVSPRTLGRQRADVISLLAAPGVVWLRRILGPFARLMVAVGNAVTPGRGFRDGPFGNEAELRDLVDMAGDSALIEDEEREMIHSVFELGDTIAREVMVPRTDMVTVTADRTVRQAMALFIRSGFSRVPVIGDDTDDPRGVLYFRDVARMVFENRDAAAVTGVLEVARPVLFIPESKPINALLKEMQADQTHLAVVVDEYGGTAGLVTIEDLIEEIVGDISDEYDREPPAVEELDDGCLRVPAVMHIDDLAELFDMEIEEDDVDTVGGLLTQAIGQVPILGSHGIAHGLELTAERMAGRRHRIASVVVRRAPMPGSEHDDLSANDEQGEVHDDH